MPPPQSRSSNKNVSSFSKYYSRFKLQIKQFLQLPFYKDLLINPNKSIYIMSGLLFLEIFLNIFIIKRTNYTEIDWKAYMQEVEGVVNGTFDYYKLKGDTGPLV
jgi:alpha-1,3-mannosyltransferase